MLTVVGQVDADSSATVPDEDGPTDAELADIEREWPLIAAEMGLVDAEIRLLCAEPHPCEVDWQRLRRAEREVAREWLALVGQGIPAHVLADAA